MTADHLGSARIITNENGAVTGRKDYTAFGEKIVTSQRTSPNRTDYTDLDEIRQGYTGYEKDGESGLEYAQARYYNTRHGRFTSVDPLTASASIRNPQSFNRYSYVLNSPYKFTDPLGLLPVTVACGGWCPNSGPYSDGPSGRDASFDWIREYFGEVAGYVLDQPDGSLVVNDIVISASVIASNGGQEKPAYTNIIVRFRQTQYVYVPVSGKGAVDARNNSGAAITAVEPRCDGNGGACLAPPELFIQPTKTGFIITVASTVYLPRWTGYNSANKSEQNLWNKFARSAKHHEDIHVLINKRLLGPFLKNKIPATVKTPKQLIGHSKFQHEIKKIQMVHDAWEEITVVFKY